MNGGFFCEERFWFILLRSLINHFDVLTNNSLCKFCAYQLSQLSTIVFLWFESFWITSKDFFYSIKYSKFFLFFFSVFYPVQWHRCQTAKFKYDNRHQVKMRRADAKPFCRKLQLLLMFNLNMMNTELCMYSGVHATNTCFFCTNRLGTSERVFWCVIFFLLWCLFIVAFLKSWWYLLCISFSHPFLL